MSSDVLINCDNVSKRFCRDLKRSLWYGLSDSAHDLFGWLRSSSSSDAHFSELRKSEFWANKNVSFEVRRGECLGLIGRNGAGKTTLLKMLNGLIKPDSGVIEIKGRVGALIALGAGFNPILTGRENICVNGSILGLSRRYIQDKLEKIVDFAEIGDSIDAPVRTYSSGMQVRLGFATAVCLVKPDVLFLDEVLAVGDVAFRAKCYNEVARLKSSTATVFVSHAMNQIATTATKGLVLQKGTPFMQGSPSAAITAYNELNDPGAHGGTAVMNLHEKVTRAEIEVDKESINFGSSLNITIASTAHEALEDVYPLVAFYSQTGDIVGEWNGLRNNKGIAKLSRESKIEVRVDRVNLTAGTYALGIQIRGQDGTVLVWSHHQHYVTVKTKASGLCPYQMQ